MGGNASKAVGTGVIAGAGAVRDFFVGSAAAADTVSFACMCTLADTNRNVIGNMSAGISVTVSARVSAGAGLSANADVSVRAGVHVIPEKNVDADERVKVGTTVCLRLKVFISVSDGCEC